MPYRLSGKRVLHKRGSKWKTKQVCSSPAAAKRAIRLLRGLHSGSIKRSQVGKGKYARKKGARKRRK